MSCQETIIEYLNLQEKIKNNMKKIEKECPEKVLKFILSKESRSTYGKLVNCTWLDSIDKKSLRKVIKIKCEDL